MDFRTIQCHESLRPFVRNYWLLTSYCTATGTQQVFSNGAASLHFYLSQDVRLDVIERNDEEIVVGAIDKHLSFWVSVYCSLPKDGYQTVSVCTIVRFHNIIGRLYFAFIWVFHKFTVRNLFRKATSF